MSTKALVTTIIVFAVLVGIAVMLNKGGPQNANSSNGPAPIIQLDPAQIRTIRVDNNGQLSTVRRTDAGGWVYDTGSLQWPVRPDAPNDLLRALTNLTGTDADASTSLGEQTTTSTVTLNDNTNRSITIANNTVGGRSVARTDDNKTVIIDAQLLDAATRPGPRAWRVASAMPGMGPVETSRITVETPDASISLARVDGAWQMHAPIGARADEQAVRGLLQTIADARAASFVDPPALPAPNIMQLDAPAMVITSQRDQRIIDDAGKVRVETQSRQLRLGGPASTENTSIYAAPDAAPSFVMVLDSDLTTSIPTSPRHYLASNATAVRPEDVWMIVIQPDSGAAIGRRRVLDEWFELRSDGTTGEAQSAPVEELLSFLANTPGEADIAAGDMRSLAKVDLLDAQGGLLDRITVGYTADAQLMARSGRVAWTYTSINAPAILAVPSFADLPALEDRPQVPEQDPNSPIKPK
ncbi:MAG: DUF4340 domain-containing protein [Phycisphaerales bacterium]